MNYILHLNGFFGRVSGDYRLNPTHISLYMALFQQWNVHRFRNPISIAREEVMATSHIHSRVTYHKCLRELHAWGYLQYVPSFNHYRGSLVYMLHLAVEEQGQKKPAFICTGGEQELDADCRGAGQDLDPSLNSGNSLNSLNKLNGGETARAHEGGSNGEGAAGSERKEKGCAEKEKKAAAAITPPTLEEVRHFFRVCGYPDLEGQRFFHHYRANGWMVGRQPMQDWQAAAHKWACNMYSQQGAHIPEKGLKGERNYAEPL